MSAEQQFKRDDTSMRERLVPRWSPSHRAGKFGKCQGRRIVRLSISKSPRSIYLQQRSRRDTPHSFSLLDSTNNTRAAPRYLEIWNSYLLATSPCLTTASPVSNVVTKYHRQFSVELNKNSTEISTSGVSIWHEFLHQVLTRPDPCS